MCALDSYRPLVQRIDNSYLLIRALRLWMAAMSNGFELEKRGAPLGLWLESSCTEVCGRIQTRGRKSGALTTGRDVALTKAQLRRTVVGIEIRVPTVNQSDHAGSGWPITSIRFASTSLPHPLLRVPRWPLQSFLALPCCPRPWSPHGPSNSWSRPPTRR